MGVLDDAIREHLDLKRRRGASDAEIAQAEAEALGPARRPVPPVLDEGDEPGPDADETRVIRPVDDVAPPPVDGDEHEQPTSIEPDLRREPTHAVHDIDEDPLAPPPPVAGTSVDDEPVESPPIDEPPIDEPPIDEPPIDRPPHEDPGGQRRF